ncbi:MAG TPA: hypothetical protein VLK85_19320 [Ramlibacter sp.]|nr:hypothetical protein [Ramlibacter sp.]
MAPSGAPPALGPDDLARQFCVPVPAEARVAAAQPPAIEQRVAVSAAPPPPHAPSRVVTARRGEVVHLVVQGPVDGAAGIHGISDILAVRSGEAVRIAFRAAYTGRFPLHFHGVDGSHFELLALEVHE